MLRWASANFTKASLAAGWGSRTPITENTSPKAARQVCPEGRPYLALNGEARDLGGEARQGARQAGGQGAHGVYTPREMSTPQGAEGVGYIPQGSWSTLLRKLGLHPKGAPRVPPSDQIREKAGSGLEQVAWSEGRAPAWELDGRVLRPALPEELCDCFLCLGFTFPAAERGSLWPPTQLKDLEEMRPRTRKGLVHCRRQRRQTGWARSRDCP